ncbi:hypothetical protein BH10PSE17_BH10PSE17_04260 [soil metagenome]
MSNRIVQILSLAPVFFLAACALNPDVAAPPVVTNRPVDSPSVASSASATGPGTAAAAAAQSPADVTTAASTVQYGSPQIGGEPDPINVTQYKLAVAEKIAKANRDALKENAPRPADKSISGLTVVGLLVRSDGTIDKAWVVRSSGSGKLDQTALASIENALPLPPPPENTMLGRGYTVFAESWLHRVDGRFQLVTKTMTTGDVDTNVAKGKNEILPAKASKPVPPKTPIKTAS